ncbi:multidrug resistance efflux pump [Marinobacterium sp. MBR-111]|uniref:efflux RND transporter periplasmic adaptor subunit n=1 Tax=Marinobacterium sp. MBR-111 TaxID=3156463 RepID=UPI00339891A8
MILKTKYSVLPHLRNGGLWLLGGCLGALTLIAVYLFAHNDSSANTPDNQWLYVQPQTLENTLGLVGRIEAASRTTVTAPFEGLIQKIEVFEGQRVERGQLLLTLDTTQLDIQLREAMADQLKAQHTVQEMRDWSQSEEVTRARRAVTNAQLKLNNTRSKLADTQRLFERGIVARMEVDTLEEQARSYQLDLDGAQTELKAALDKGEGTNRRIAEMELTNAQAKLKVLQEQREEHELHAPFSGIVLRPRKQEGGSADMPLQGIQATRGMPLFELVSMERIKAVTRVEEADLHLLRENMPVQISGDGFSGITLQGVVGSIGANTLSTERYGGGSTYEVSVNIDPLTKEQQQRIRLGMSARLAIVTYHAENGLVLPGEALHQDHSGQTFVIYRSDMSQPPTRVTVTTGRAMPGGVEVFGIESGYVEIQTAILNKNHVDARKEETSTLGALKPFGLKHNQ